MRLFLLGFFLIISFYSNSQNYYEEDFFDPINDSSLEGQISFVEELLDLAGYVPEKISLYQSLPNKAHVFKVKLDSIFGGFIFVRWDKEKNENYIANKLIEGYIIGFFNGRIEYGPRALGSRSIIADPRSENMQKNLKSQ